MTKTLRRAGRPRGLMTGGLHDIRSTTPVKPHISEGHTRLHWDIPDWTADALCAQTDPESFFPEKGGSTREAKAVCQRCTVRDECLEYAVDNQERYGIWGGLSERQRRKLYPSTGPDPYLSSSAKAAWDTRRRNQQTPS